MKPLVLAFIATALSTAGTLSFSQSAKADYPYDHRSYEHRDYREYRPYDHDRDDRRWRDSGWRDHRWYGRREYYGPRYYYGGGYYRHPHTHFDFVIPLIIR
jgi:hypothetical protein